MSSPRSIPLRSASHTSDLVWLVLATLVVLAALVLEVRPDQKVALAFLPNYPLPETCTARSLLGIDCLLCGMTRSQVYLAHGRWSDAFAVHRLGWLAALLIVSQIPYRLLRISGWVSPPGRGVTISFSVIVLGLLVVNWFDRCLRQWL